MSVRFRIRTSQGQEISFASHEMFAEFVRSGELSPDDVVFDAETKEWSSALTHPVVLQIELESEEAEESSGSEATRAEEAPAATAQPSQDDIGLDLAPAPSQLTPEQEEAAFVKKMEAERASEIDHDDEPAFEGFHMEGPSGLVGGLADVEEEEPPPPPPPKPRPPRQRDEARDEQRRREPPPRRQEPVKAPKRKKKSGAARKYAPFLILGAVLVAAGVYFGPELMSTASTTDGGSTATDSVVLPPPPPPLIPDTEDALRERAQERFLSTTRALLRDLPPIPDVWLSGAYLAAPSDYPEVREVWNQYLTTVRQVRAGDNERYRAGYLRALDDARVEGSARTLRLASAVAAFQSEVAPRAAHYDRVEALIQAALRGHDALVEAEGTIAYEPAATTPVSGDPVIEAVGRNPDAQALLNQVLDMILTELDPPNGPGNVSQLSEWIWNGILAAVTN